MVNLHLRREVDDSDNPGLYHKHSRGCHISAFRYLSFLTDNDRDTGKQWNWFVFRLCIYLNLVNLVLSHESHQRCEATVTRSASKFRWASLLSMSTPLTTVQRKNGQFIYSDIRLSPRGDLYYEYHL